MRYIDCSEHGGPEVLTLNETDTPAPAAGELLIRVEYSGVNRADTVQRQGFYPPPPGASAIPGLEVAGEVLTVGEGVEGWSPGMRVCALLSGGGYADHAIAAAAECLPIPESVSTRDAAGLPETVMTVWSNVMDRAGLQAGESFLVHGGSSGIGTTAIQLVKLHGCQVFATAGSDEKVQACLDLGADLVVNYRQQDYLEAVLEHTEGRGVDVILDMVGGDYMQKNVLLAAVGGRIVNIAYLQGSKVEVNMMPVMLKRLIITGSTLRAREVEFKAALTSSVQEKVWPWLEEGSLKSIIHASFPAAEVAEAHRVMESSQHIGKLLLEWD